MKNEALVNIVAEQYSQIARSALSNDSDAVQSIARAFGYSQAELDSLPPQANMGLSCGNPLALSGVRAGEVVVDLGCGGGLDVFLAATKVGPTGKAIGIDMTAEMLERARAGAAQIGASNVEFHQSLIDDLPLGDASVDCIISNCVINLAPDKPAVFREMLRVLKPGGRISISDIALRRPLPESVAKDIHAYVGCIAGAVLIDDYVRMLREAGFEAVLVTDTRSDLSAYAAVGEGVCCGSASCGCDTPASSCCQPSGATQSPGGFHAEPGEVLSEFNANQYAASVRVYAVKPWKAG